MAEYFDEAHAREIASLEIRGVAAMNSAEYADLLARGYRRFGWQVFRPACPNCTKCRSIRIGPVRVLRLDLCADLFSGVVVR